MTPRATTPDVSIASEPIDLAGLPDVPGARLRRWRGFDADMRALWQVSDAARAADNELQRNTLEGMTSYYRHLERCDLDRDLVIAELDGRFAGYARVEWTDSNDGERWYEGACNVDPTSRRRGVGTLLLAWSERRRLAIAAEQAATFAAGDQERALTTFTFDGDEGGRILLERAGYTAFRRFASMQRPDLAEIPSVPMPVGLDVRSVPREAGPMRQVFDADVEAFRDHFGWSDGSDERFAAFVEDPDVDPDLWLVAFDGDEVAGAVLNGIHVDADGVRTGWLDSIFTRRPWRQRGLARALIARSLGLLRERGLSSASLGVDLTNPHQALALYESCGFRTMSVSTAYRKPLPTLPARQPEELPR